MDQKLRFVLEAEVSENLSELCRKYGISRRTGYKWRARYLEKGLEGLAEESRRPENHSQELSEAVVCEIVRLKHAHPHWGPRKIQALYKRTHRSRPLPCESSFKRVLDRAGLVERRKRRVARECGRLSAGRRAEAPNQIWSVDFKGWWRDAQGLKVEPLTVRDEYSRMILELRALEGCGQIHVRACFERLFELHGLPGAIRSDNGPPFACTQGLLGLTRLSAWWLALGIDLERGRPGKPQDNGAHERMHRDIRDELEAGRIGREQAAFDLWREEFNQERPHESLGMATPAEFYRPSERRYENTPEELDYGSMETRRLHPRTGTLTYRGQRVAISVALAGWNVGLAPRGDGLVEVWFANLMVGLIDPTAACFQAARPGRLEAGVPDSQLKPSSVN